MIISRDRENLWGDQRVAVAALADSEYRPGPLAQAVAQVAGHLKWGSESGGPLGAAIPHGARVLIKPNWVTHANQGPWGMEPLITHAEFVKVCTHAALETSASSVMIGDAPIQACLFEELVDNSGLREWEADLRKSDPRFLGIRDFRRTKSRFQSGIRVAYEDLLPEDQFVLFDLGVHSLLEPVTDERSLFRVTQYDPTLMVRTHGPGRHQYLVSREVISSDVIINLPKLKTHRKAGITCALKNLIGINGNKEFLPHHRVGGSLSGGDCYPGRSVLKRALEYAFDRLNLADLGAHVWCWYCITEALSRVLAFSGDKLGVEGAWHGNDTVWRTGLDLNRIALYGRLDGTLASELQRSVLHIVDAVTAGHGDGPLAPKPLPLGLVIGGSNASALDWVGALLLGYDPARIPMVREAFARFRWPVTPFTAQDVTILGALGDGIPQEVLRGWQVPSPIEYPPGWLPAVINGAAAASIVN